MTFWLQNHGTQPQSSFPNVDKLSFFVWFRFLYSLCFYCHPRCCFQLFLFSTNSGLFYSPFSCLKRIIFTFSVSIAVVSFSLFLNLWRFFLFVFGWYFNAILLSSGAFGQLCWSGPKHTHTHTNAHYPVALQGFIHVFLPTDACPSFWSGDFLQFSSFTLSSLLKQNTH